MLRADIRALLVRRDEDYIHRVGRVGRADVMGLAISLVSKVPEKVWQPAASRALRQCCFCIGLHGPMPGVLAVACIAKLLCCCSSTQCTVCAGVVLHAEGVQAMARAGCTKHTHQ